MFVFAPNWFFSTDILIEVFSFFILILFFVFSYKNYNLRKNKKALYLGVAFLLIALGEILSVLSKFALYYDFTFSYNIGKMIITYTMTYSTQTLYKISFFFHRLLTLAGLFIIYRIPLKKEVNFSDAMLVTYFIILSSLFGVSIYYLFHITVLIFLILIINNYYKIYVKNKSENTKLLINAFGVLALGHIVFILSSIKIIYVLAQIIQLVSYLMLLFLILRILKHGKKKKSH